VCAWAYKGVYDFILLHLNRIMLFWEKSGKKVGKKWENNKRAMSNNVIRYFEKRLKNLQLSIDFHYIINYNIIKVRD